MSKRIETMNTGHLMAYLGPKYKVEGLEFAEGEEDEIVLVFESESFVLVIEGEAEALVESFSNEPRYMQEVPRF